MIFGVIVLHKYVKSSSSTSTAFTLNEYGISSSKSKSPISSKTGASLIGFIVIVTTAGGSSESKNPSLAIYVKLSSPLNSAFGV